MRNSVNDQLRAIYETHYEELKHEFVEQLVSDGVQPTNPLLIYVDEAIYQESDFRIMFFGQETYDWEGPFGDKSISDLLEAYQGFLRVVNGHKYRSPFWNMVLDYIESVRQKNPDKKIDYVWNNILKVGMAKAKGTPPQEIVKLTQEHFPAIKAEVEILKPDVVVFFTGPYYDQYIKHEFPDAEFMKIQDMKEREICQVKSAYLPTRTFRTYHPGYLVRGKQELFKVLKDL